MFFLFQIQIFSKQRNDDRLGTSTGSDTGYHFQHFTLLCNQAMVCFIDAHELKIQGKGYLKFLPKSLGGGQGF